MSDTIQFPSERLISALWRTFHLIDPGFRAIGFGAFIPGYLSVPCPEGITKTAHATALAAKFGITRSAASAALTYVTEKDGRNREEYFKLLGVDTRFLPPPGKPAAPAVSPPASTPVASRPVPATPTVTLTPPKQPAPTPVAATQSKSPTPTPAEVIELVKLGICTPSQGAAMLGLAPPVAAPNTVAPPAAEAAPIAPPVAAPNTVAPPTEKTLRTLPVRMEVLDIQHKFINMTPGEALPVYLAAARQEPVDFDRAMSAVKLIQALTPDQLHALLEAADAGTPIPTSVAVPAAEEQVEDDKTFFAAKQAELDAWRATAPPVERAPISQTTRDMVASIINSPGEDPEQLETSSMKWLQDGEEIPF
jgi:hypothetical protein